MSLTSVRRAAMLACMTVGLAACKTPQAKATMSPEPASAANPAPSRWKTPQRHLYIFEKIVDVAERKVAWEQTEPLHTVVDDGEVLFVLGEDRSVTARQLADGIELWRLNVWDKADALLQGGDFVYVVGIDGRIDRLHKVDASSLTLKRDGELAAFVASQSGTFAVCSRDELRILNATSGQVDLTYEFSGQARRGPDYQQVKETVEGAREGWRETDSPPALHLAGSEILLERELKTGTELRLFTPNGDQKWEKRLFANGGYAMHPLYIEGDYMAFSGTGSQPLTLVMETASGDEVGRWPIDTSVALVKENSLLSVENDALVSRTRSGHQRWKVPRFAEGFDANHRLAAGQIDDTLLVVWYHSIGQGILLSAMNAATGKVLWSRELQTTTWAREPFRHNLVTVETIANNFVITADEVLGMTVQICDRSGECWYTDSQIWR